MTEISGILMKWLMPMLLSIRTFLKITALTKKESWQTTWTKLVASIRLVARSRDRDSSNGYSIGLKLTISTMKTWYTLLKWSYFRTKRSWSSRSRWHKSKGIQVEPQVIRNPNTTEEGSRQIYKMKQQWCSLASMWAEVLRLLWHWISKAQL